ncbi:Serine/threonine-protein kinase PknD [Paenibacillus solanacearum]|uniref:non-specific serine/threonine protein kinase n=1 Tax=Paenibacillus solanacearum TaxID=2048548 RepID=A0A916K5B3_9BACL|nr:serine/threonine-protein kinase [Paenibacillus solanacearum]CAG7628381.1 Serine/threonine-protein kinase PknD [Paenibacillus solanacearum]
MSNRDVTGSGLGRGDILADRYRIVSVIGSGGMSRVLLAEDMKLEGKRWAVKEMYAGGARTERDGADAALRRSMLLAEAEMMSRLSHPNLPDIVDVFPVNREGYLYLVMDYIEGETLLERFERQGRRMAAEQVAEVAQQLCELLDYLHTLRPEPIVHRDLKPSNLMLDAGGRVRLIDFGTARRYKAGRDADTVALGTVGFAAPEQYDGRQSDPRTDLYGLGALMYYLLTGGAYYAAGQLSREAAALPEGLAPLVLRLLRASPEERYASAREAGEALRRWLASRQPQPAAAVPGAAWTPPLLVAVGALYPGAGATFAALALARLLHDHGVPHAVIEPPTAGAELAALLFAVKNAPPGYRCYNTPAAVPGSGIRQDERAWTEGHTLWLPAEEPAPRQQAATGETAEAFGSAYWLKLLHAMRRPVLIADVGAAWEHPAVAGLLEAATDIVYIVDPQLHKLELVATRHRLRELGEWSRAPGRRLHCFANKRPRSAQSAVWLQLLPQPPACTLPAVEAAFIAEAGWAGRLPHDMPAIRQSLRQAIQPWLKAWLRDNAVSGAKKQRSERQGLATKLRSMFQ